jgi:23S rRNA G2069 N7-methylase RlmK/C1962 C5-methylase RlmI
MPNSETFSVKPIGNFVKKYIEDSVISIDPFARNSKLATYTNDLNPNTEALYHLDAVEFCQKMKDENIRPDLIIFDPPYSPRAISECYQSIGKKATQKDTQNSLLYKNVRDILDDILAPNGTVLSFGWNSSGMGTKREYEIVEILLVCHGSAHNDTICIAERKIKNG